MNTERDNKNNTRSGGKSSHSEILQEAWDSGSRNRDIKLSEPQVEAIREIRGMRQVDIAKEYGVNQSYISRLRAGIRRGKR